MEPRVAAFLSKETMFNAEKSETFSQNVKKEMTEMIKADVRRLESCQNHCMTL